jgi:antitoxin ParD1/3/4
MIVVPAEFEPWIDAQVAAGLYHDPRDVVAAALRLLQQRERERAEALAELKAKIAVGIAQLERGEYVDAEAVFDELERELSEGDFTP